MRTFSVMLLGLAVFVALLVAGHAVWADASDSDNDGWVDTDGPVDGKASEAYLGTEWWDDCSDDPSHDAWPPDVNRDTLVNILDVLKFKPYLGDVGGDSDGDTSIDEDPVDGIDNDSDGQVDEDPPNQRYDLNQDGVVDIDHDINEVLAPYMNTQCTNP